MRIKRSILLMFLAGSAIATAASDEYCAGYMDGYREGYYQTAGAPPIPMSPLCPMKPPRAEGDTRSDEKRGYDKGFKDGTRDGSNASR